MGNYEIKKGKEIGRKGNSYYAWKACPDCRKERWVMLRRGKPTSLRCHACAGKAQRGDKNYNWHGGKTITGGGHIRVKLSPTDFFYSMANSNGYALEHRLVMAKHLGRCLQPWEIVHHKNHNKKDNQIENLQLVSDDRHRQITILETKIDKQTQLIEDLRKEIRLLRWQLKEVMPASEFIEPKEWTNFTGEMPE